MAPNDNAEQPLIPRRWASMYDCEHDSDVVFIVGEQRERMPGHRDILARANPVFHGMLKGPLANAEPIPIVDVEGRAFDQLLRYLYKEEVRIQSVTTALLTLSAAHKYMCEELVDACISYLDAHITVDNALEILDYIVQFTQCPPPLPSAPPLNSPGHQPHNHPRPHPNPTPFPPNITCEDLLHNTLQFIDSNANEILAQEYFEDLDSDRLQLILSRDTLRVSSELVVCRVLNRWSHRECKRKQLALTDENKRMVLGEDTVFMIRFLLLTEQEFIDGPANCGLLDPADSRFIFSQIAGGGGTEKKYEELVPIWRARRDAPDTGARPLSCRTCGVKWRGAELGGAGGGGGKAKSAKSQKKNAKKEKKRSASLSSEREKKGNGSKVLECFVAVVACVFD